MMACGTVSIVNLFVEGRCQGNNDSVIEGLP